MPTCIVPGCSNRSGEAHKGKIQKKIEKEMGVNITFHRLPLNPTRRKQWLDNLEIRTPQQKNPMICSVHFKEVAFDRTSLSCVRLRETAIPYITVPTDDTVSPYQTKVDAKSSQEPIVEVVPLKQTTIDDKMSLEHIEEFIPTSIQESDDTVNEESQLVEGKRLVHSFTSTTLEQFSSLSEDCRTKATSPSSTLRDTTAVTPQERHLRRALENVKNFYRRKIKTLTDKHRRSEKRVALLKNVLKSLETKKYMIDEQPDILRNTGWLTSVPCEPTRAFCTYCKKNLHAHRLSLLKHTCTMKHQRSALMHQNNVIAKNAMDGEKITKIEAELEDEPEEGEVRVMDASFLGQVKMLDREEDDEEIEYVVERLDMDDEEFVEQCKSEQNQMEEEEEEEEVVEEEEGEDEIERENRVNFELSGDDEDVKPSLKKIKIERNNEKCRDTLAEAMAHVHGEYLDENNEQINMQLEMEVEFEDTNPQEMQVMSTHDTQNNENDTVTKNIEENEEHSRRSGDEGENGQSTKKSSQHEGDSNELTIGNKVVILRSSSKLNPVYQINSSKASSPSTSGSQQPPCNTVTIAPIQNKTITLTSHDGKTLTVLGGKFSPSTQYVLNKMKGKFPTLFMADKKPIVVSNQSGRSPRYIQPKTARLVQSVPSIAVPSNSQQFPKKHVILKSIKPSSLKKPRISTHVLDTSKGLPVSGLQVSLYKLMDGRWTFLNESNTLPNGRCIDLVDSNKCNFTAGRYKIHFDVDKYFTLRRIETMYPFIEIVFDVKNPTGHYHIPVLLSPFYYMTYHDSER